MKQVNVLKEQKTTIEV